MRPQREADRIDDNGTRVIIAGHGRYGMTVGRMLSASGIKAVVLDHDAEQIDALRKFGFKVYYGDASRHDLLEAAGAAEAQDPGHRDRRPREGAARSSRLRVDTSRTSTSSPAPSTACMPTDCSTPGVEDVHREVFASSVDMGERLLARAGRSSLRGPSRRTALQGA